MSDTLQSSALIDKNKLIKACEDCIQTIDDSINKKIEKILAKGIKVTKWKFFWPYKEIFYPKSMNEYRSCMDFYGMYYYPEHEYDEQRNVAVSLKKLAESSSDLYVQVTASDFHFIRTYFENLPKDS